MIWSKSWRIMGGPCHQLGPRPQFFAAWNGETAELKRQRICSRCVRLPAFSKQDAVLDSTQMAVTHLGLYLF